MPAFDLELIDPAAAAVEKAMYDAVDTANQRCRVGLMNQNQAEYRRFLENDFLAPEGVGIWLPEKGKVEEFPPTPRATLLGVVWRTDPLGRRVVRIAGRRIEPFKEHASHRFGPPWQVWPPMCHMDPDHIVMRTLAGGKPEAIAICECGMVGPPEKLGWRDGRCGVCHDHLEEHGKPLDSCAGPVVLRTAGRLVDVAFLPSGQKVIAIEWVTQGEIQVTWWDRATGSCDSGRGNAVTALPESMRGVAGALVSYDSLLYWATEKTTEPYLLRAPSPVVNVWNNGTEVTAVGYNGATWRTNLVSEENWQAIGPERRTGRDVVYMSVAISPDGKMALGQTDCLVDLLDRTGEGPRLQPVVPGVELEVERFRTLAFSPDGKLLAGGASRSGFVSDPREEWYGRAGGLYLFDAEKGEYLGGFPTPKDDIMSVVFSPDGSLLFYGSTDCTVGVLDVATRSVIATLSGHVGDVNALAFSPDGEILASAGGDGLVRLWPWRQILGRLKAHDTPMTKEKSAPAKRKRR